MSRNLHILIVLIISSTFMGLKAQKSSNTNSNDYYYYWNKRIDLKPRTDRVLVIFKEGAISDNAQQSVLVSAIQSPGDNVNKIDQNTWMIKTPDIKSVSEAESFIQSLAGKSADIKIVSKVYFGESGSVIQYPTDEVIVKLRNLSDKPLLEALNQKNKAYIISNVSNNKGFLIKTNNSSKLSGLQLAELYRKAGIFEFVEPNFGYAEWSLLHHAANDPLFTSQWALKNTAQAVTTGGSTTYGDVVTTNGLVGADMGVATAWDYTTGNASILVGIVDTGIDSLHADLAGKLVLGFDATTNKYGASIDPYGHGTQCAGLIGAVMDNNIGVAGVAPLTKLMNIRIFNSSGTTTSTNILRGLDTAFVKKVDLLSNSWGGGSPSAAQENSFNNHILNGRNGLGAICLASSGNNSRNPSDYPAAYDKMVSVGASTQQDIKKSPGTGNQAWWGGNYGEFSPTSYLAFVAPTVCYTTASGGGYNATFNGTSAACPNAAGVAALVLAVNPALTSAQVYEIMARGADKIDNVAYSKSKPYGKWNDYYGYGRLNAYHSVRLAAATDVTPPTIVHQNIKSHSSTYPTTITATIIDQDGTAVPATGSNKPILFYRHKLNGGVWSDFDSAGAVSNSGSVFNFKIPGFGHGTEVQYYFRAKDASGNENTFPKHAQSLNPYTLCFYAIGQMVSYSAKMGVWSFDNAYSNSPVITVPNTFNKPLVDLSVQVYLRHTWINDLSFITLWSPDGDAGNNRKAIWGQNYPSSIATTYGGIKGSLVSDSATSFWKNGYLSSGLWTGGNYKPDHPFQGLMGINMDGNWKFTGRDIAGPDITNFDSIRLNLTGLDDILSSCAKHDTPNDTIAFFLSSTSPCQKDFYIKSTGNADLSITGFSISGDFASKFTLLNTPASTVAPGDSSLYSLAFNPLPLLPGGNPVVGENAVLTIFTNDPSKANFRVSLQNGDSVFCINPVNSGTISSAQSGCSPFDPLEITVTDPTGNDGILEYQWQASTDSISFANLSTGTYTATTYDPDPLTVSTWYRRLVKVTCESAWTSSDTVKITVNQLPTAIASEVTSVTCYGGNSGSVSVTVSGGQSAYSYAWSSNPVQTTSTATALLSGIYTVTVTDANGCTASASATVSQPDELTASASVVANVSIYEGSDGSVSVSSGGGTTPYSYTWSCDPAQSTQTAIGLTTGTYWVTVTDANSCSATSSILVTQPTPPGVQVINVLVTSVGNTQATIDWTRGNSDGCTVFIIEGNTGTALPANNVSYPANTLFGTSTSQVGTSGWYCVYDGTGTQVTVTGLLPLTEYRVHICEYKLGSKTYNISSSTNNPSNFTTFSSISAIASVISNVSCFGYIDGSVTVSVSGGNPPYSYLWSSVPAQSAQSATGLSAGNYTVTVTDGASTSITSSVLVTQPTQWWPELTGPTPVCQNSIGNVYATDLGMTDYTWLVSAGGTITSGGSGTDNTVTITWTGFGPQTVSVNYTNLAGCVAAAPKVKNVMVNVAPTPVITGEANVTQSQVVTYSTPYNAGNTYSWNASHGNPELCFPYRNCLTLTWDFPCGIINPGYVRVTETNTSTGCSTTVTKWITIAP